MQPNLIDHLIDGLEKALQHEYSNVVEEFLTDYAVDTWVIASDYSMGRKDFTHDAMAFVLIPYIKDLFPPDDIEKKLPVDFKNCGKTIPSAYLAYLRNAPVFNYVFLLEKPLAIFATPELAGKALQASLSMMRNWPNAREPHIAEIIRKSELCLNEAKTKSFLRKVNEVTLLSALGAFVGLTATRLRQVKGMIWAPDRDNMTGVWDGLSSAMFHTNFHSALHRRSMPENYKHGEFVDKPDVDELWFDPYVRLADFLATPAAAMTRKTDAPQANYDKSDEVVREVFADNPRLILQTLSFSMPTPTEIKPEVRLVKMSKTPFPPPQS